MDKAKKILLLIISIFLPLTAGLISVRSFSYNAVSGWYAALEKPLFTPPDWLFAPAWMALYALMGIALYFVLKKGFEDKEKNNQVKFFLILFALHLVFNVLWPVFFFGLFNIFAALIEILLLLAMILVLCVLSLRIDKRAFYLLTPYLLWTFFAAVLNFFIWRLNL